MSTSSSRAALRPQDVLCSVLLFCLLNIVPCVVCQGQQQTVASRKLALLELWSKAYGLNDTFPPDTIPGINSAFSTSTNPTAPPLSADAGGIPVAPHLEECVAADRVRQKFEEYPSEGSGSSFPEWTCASGTGKNVVKCDNPTPPWVSGADSDNLRMTRVVQRDIWMHQFPRDCEDPNLRFLIVPWYWERGQHGFGSQLHLMSAALSRGMQYNRIVVFQSGTFHHADHKTCQSLGKRSTISCYFFPITPEKCAQRAERMYKDLLAKKVLNGSEFISVADLSKPISVLWLQTHEEVLPKHESSIVRKWGQAAMKDYVAFAFYGNAITGYWKRPFTWWRAQTTRFILRWSTPYLCHLTNIARNDVFGAKLAEDMAVSELSLQIHWATWPQSLLKIAGSASSGSQIKPWGFQDAPVDEEVVRMRQVMLRPYLPRPVISMFVRRGDKGREMKLMGTPYYMWLVERIRILNPGIHNIFLSTESQEVFQEIKAYRNWTFFYTPIKWKATSKSANEYAKEVGMEEYVGNTFVNLLIAAECDYYVGTLASNLHRLVNELRMTGGRFKSYYMALNNAEY